ncbi:hypothetical protein EGW08_016878 [Elysia chlorotica]|uniref:Uncharacterized protein n=1 Tax=Elysia chlorotica TaxID=188477 RepID=A0A3S1B5C4_ELYCH|nr:hypothetical protein EGW08_016878 [Elysia chlorotica]
MQPKVLVNCLLGRMSRPEKVKRLALSTGCTLVEYGGVSCSMVEYGGLWCRLVECGVVWCRLVECGVDWWSVVEYGGVCLFIKLCSASLQRSRIPQYTFVDTTSSVSRLFKYADL